MNRSTRVAACVLVAVFALAALGVGCSSKESTETEAASDKQTTYGRAVDKAQETVAALANPKAGIDPVCGMAIDENAVVVTINDKQYGLCSNSCAETLAADPEKYLAAASTDAHEDH